MKIRTSIYVYSSILTVAVLLLLYGINIALQNTQGPVRSVVYVPGGMNAAGFWVLLDTLAQPARRFQAHFHSSMRFGPVKPSNSPGVAETKLTIRGKSFRILSLNGESHTIASGLLGARIEDSLSLAITGDRGSLLTLLLPVDVGDPDPVVSSMDSGRTHFFHLGNRGVLIHLGTGGTWRVPSMDFTSNSNYLVATWEKRDHDSLPVEKSLLAKSGSTTIWGEETIRLGDGNQTGTVVSVWERGKTISPIVIDSAIAPGKAPGLISQPLDIKAGLSNPGNYGWKCDRVKLAAHFENGRIPDSYFMPARMIESIKSDTGNWKEMLNAYRKLTWDLMEPSVYPEDKLPFLVAYTAMVARADQNPALKAWVINTLLKLDTAKLKIESFTEMRAHYGWWYLTAYDLISPSLSISQREEIRRHLKEYLNPVLESIPYLAVNATDMVLKTTLGLAGLLLNEPDWVDMMVNHLDWYMDFGIPEGIAYEGNLYLGIAFNYVPIFSDILNRSGIGNVDFFKDERFQSMVASLIMQISPNWNYPCFEDCNHLNALSSLVASAGAGFSRAASETADNRLANLASMCKWVEANGQLTPEHAWLPDIPLFSDNKAKPVQPTFSTLGDWMPEYHPRHEWLSFPKMRGGALLLRNGWGRESDLFALSAKNYDQSHTHMDELSFELWSLGENWLSNPEYAGFGERHHALSVLTQSSNSLTIDGEGQVNPKGSRISKAVFGQSIRYAEADGTGLYRHPDREVCRHFAIAGSIILGLMWGAVLWPALVSRRAFPQEGFAARKKSARTTSNPTLALSIRALATPFARKSDLRIIALCFRAGGASPAMERLGRIGFGMQGAVLGSILCLGTAYFFHLLIPFVKVYADDQRYRWMRYFLETHGLLTATAFGTGIAIAAVKFKLLDLFRTDFGSRKDPENTMLRKSMRLVNMEVFSLGLIALVATAGLIISKPEIRFALLGSNPDAWSFQSHLCSYVSGPLLIITLFLFLKLVIQCFTARKYALLLFYITGSRKWYSHGLHSALITVSIKKAAWLAAGLFLFCLLLALSSNLSAETLTRSLK